MKILVASDREYKKTSRGIDIITTLLANKGHSVDHLVFFRRKNMLEKQITNNIKQLYFYDFLGLYRDKMRIFMPGFLLLLYFSFIIKKQNKINFSIYDWVVIESGYPVYLSLFINNKIIFRISDPPEIAFNNNRKFYKNIELEVIKKSSFVTTAISTDYYPDKYKDKIYFWHSGYTPINSNRLINQKKEFIFMGGGEIDFKLIKKIVMAFPDYIFHIIGSFKTKNIKHDRIIFHGYLEYDDYQKLVLNSMVCVIPFTNRFANQLKRCHFTAKILLPLSLGMPVLLKNYGIIQESDPEKKLFVYKTHDEGLFLLDEILKKIESGQINRDISKKTYEYLFAQSAENRLKELDLLLTEWIK